jgi:hypothetical protein
LIAALVFFVGSRSLAARYPRQKARASETRGVFPGLCTLPSRRGFANGLTRRSTGRATGCRAVLKSVAVARRLT